MRRRREREEKRMDGNAAVPPGNFNGNSREEQREQRVSPLAGGHVKAYYYLSEYLLPLPSPLT